MNFFCKLLPPRPSFLLDMTEEEGRLMQEHASYWREWMARGNIIAFGVVADPAAVFGAGMVEFESLEEVQAFTEGDPTIQAGRGFRFEVHPMPFGVVRA